MSASQRVQFLNDQVGHLSILAEFIKNPNLISDLEEEVKKLNSLTAAEEKKIKDARDFIATYEKNLYDLSLKNEELEKKIQSHNEGVIKFIADTQDIRNLDNHLKNKAILQDEVEKRQSADRQKLEEDRAKLARQNDQERAHLKEELDRIKAERATLENEKDRVAALDRSLKDKAKAMAALVG